MKTFYRDKAFIVTGADSGIGRATTKRLLQMGAAVTVMARTGSRLESIEPAPTGRLCVCPGDVTRTVDCQRAVEKTLGTFGRIDGLIHNASLSMRAGASETDLAVFRYLMEVNFFSMVHLYKLTADHLTASRGHLVAVSSMMGRYATQQRSGYTASKHALQGFMDSVRLEVADRGIHVMVVSPGFVRTDGSRNALSADGTPHGQMDPALASGLSPETVARVIPRGMRSRKRDAYPAQRREKLGLFLSKWSPSCLDRLLLKTDIK